MRKHPGLAASIGLAGVAFMSWYLAVQPSREGGPSGNRIIGTLQQPQAVGLEISPQHLDFGVADDDTVVEWSIPIANTSATEQHITRFVTGCNCIDVIPQSLVIPPSTCCTVTVKLNLVPYRRSRVVAAYRDFKSSLQAVACVGSEAPMPLAPWELTGKVRTILELGRSNVDLGKHSEYSQPIPQQIITVKSLVALRRITAKCTSGRFEAQLARIESDPSSYDLAVKPVGLLPIMRYTFNVTLHVTLGSGKELQRIDIPVTGEVLPDLQCTPSTVTLGARSRGATVEETVTLYSLSGRPFEVVSQAIESDGLTIEVLPISQGNRCASFRLSQKIIRIGGQTGTARFLIRGEDSRKTELCLPIDYHGLE
jgi:hypothetical protein